MKNIDKLLEKYFEGETSLEEEKILRQYFRQPDIDERHKIYAPMLNFFSEERKEVAIIKKRKKIPFYVWTSIAASILLVLCVKLFVDVPNTGSLVYINGKKITDINTINSEALISLENISDVNEDVINSQITVLDSFIE